ncbi:hypothetical protein EMCRGX_G019834 [Ephydatia muelleri]|eukprot:Em0011g196a
MELRDAAGGTVSEVRYSTGEKASLLEAKGQRTPLKNGHFPSKILIYLVVLIFSVTIAAIVGIMFGRYAVPSPSSSAASRSSPQAEICAKPPLLLISLDGFWAGYLNRSLPLYLQSYIGATGVIAPYMIPVFPSKTFPNHFSIVTGLYPDVHGIVDNNFYDSVLEDSFSIGGQTQNDVKWWLGEPVWVTAKKQGLRTAVYFWPGSEVPIQGIYPDIYFQYSTSTPFAQRVSTVLSWFDFIQEKRPQFMALYFNKPDEEGHTYGPFSAQVDEAVGEVDAILQTLFVGLAERNISNCVNVMIVSDHGMAALNSSLFVSFNEVIPSNFTANVSFESYGVNAQINVTEGLIDEVFKGILNNTVTNNLPFTPYKIKDVPSRFQIAKYNPQRYGDIYLLGNLGSYINKAGSVSQLGNHGYDNLFSEMQSIFVAHGPAFKQGNYSKPVDSINLYNLMCELLKITPSRNNGTSGALDYMLKTLPTAR